MLPVSLAIAAYSAVLLGVFFLQRRLIYLPNPHVADPKAQGGRLILLQAISGERHAAVYYPPIQPDAAVLVFFHGNADQIGYGASFLGRAFQQHGLGFYGIEYPGYGLARPGSPSEASIVVAAETLLQHLAQELKVPRSRIVLFGQSLGCAVAVEMARRGFGSRLVLLSPFTSIIDMSIEVYPFLKLALKVAPWMVLDPWDNKTKAPALDLPMLVLHGVEDEVVPFWMGRMLAILTPKAQLLPLQHCGHNDTLDRAHVLKAIADFAQTPVS